MTTTRFSWEKDLPAGEAAKPAAPKETVVEPPKDAAKARALASDKVAGQLEGKTVAQVVFVPDRLVNLVVR